MVESGGGGGGGGGGQNVYELLNLRALKISIKVISFNVWVRYFVWNFKGYLWNCTQNIIPIHWEMWILFTCENLRALRFKSSLVFLTMSFCQYRNSNCGDKIDLWTSYLDNGISHTGMMAYLYWIRSLVITVCCCTSAITEWWTISEDSDDRNNCSFHGSVFHIK